MSVPLVINGITFNYPQQFDVNWGPTLTAWSTAVTNGMLQKAGGSFPLTSEVDFGNSFGIRTKYLKSEESNVASTGVIRLAAQSEGIAFRNTINSSDLVLTTNSSNMLEFNGVILGPPTALLNNHIYVGNVSNQPADVAMSGDATIINTGVLTISNNAITNIKVSTSAAIDRSKLASGNPYAILANDVTGVMSENATLNPDFAIVSNANGQLADSVTTTTELSYVSGVTSSIQTQIDNITGASTFVSGDMKVAAYSSVPSGWLLCDGTSYLRATYPALFSAIGTTYGSVDGTHFNVPNMVNAVAIGAGSIAAMGVTAGSATVTVIQNSHSHTETAHTHTLSDVGGSTSSINYAAAAAVVYKPGASDQLKTPLAGGGEVVQNVSRVTGTQSNDAVNATTATNQASSVVQPSLGVTWFIKQ